MQPDYDYQSFSCCCVLHNICNLVVDDDEHNGEDEGVSSNNLPNDVDGSNDDTDDEVVDNEDQALSRCARLIQHFV